MCIFSMKEDVQIKEMHKKRLTEENWKKITNILLNALIILVTSFITYANLDN